MRRFIILLCALILVPSAAWTAEKKLGFVGRSELIRALANERAAAARYDACAIKADEEGYAGAASLFRAAAKAERVHAGRFEKMLEAGGETIPADATPKVTIASTADNLRAAAVAEQNERDRGYRDARDNCRKAGDNEVADVFDQTRDAEIEHMNLFTNAARDLEKMRAPRSYYVCTTCGYTMEISMPLCPSCRAKHVLEEVH